MIFMGMGFGLQLRVEQKPELRQCLEQRLEHKLEQQHRQELTLGQYLQQEDIITGLIRYADEHNTWKNVDKEGFNFSYALVPYKLAKPIADIAGPGFAHCLLNPFEGRAMGTWNLFVVDGMMPDKFRELVAFHERGEEISLGNHYFSSQLEFALAKKWKQVKDYIGFIDSKYPSKFVDLTEEVLFPILPEELTDFLTQQGRRNESELRTAERLIEEYPLPSEVLKFMDRYERKTEKVCELLKSGFSATQGEIIGIRLNRLTTPEEINKIVNIRLTNIFEYIDGRLYEVVSKPRAEEMYRFVRKLIETEAYATLGKHLILPRTFEEAHFLSMQGKPLANIS